MINLKKGFTLVELIIVIGIMAILAVVVSPIYGGLQSSSQLNANTSEIAQNLRVARGQSINGVNNVNHGVKFFNHNYVIYYGASYDYRLPEYDRNYSVPDSVTISSTFTNNEINFSKGTGAPASSGIVSLAHSVNGNKQVIVNRLGIAYE